MCIYVCVYIYIYIRVYIYIYICRHRSNRIAGFLATALRQVPFSVVPSLQTPGAEWGAPRGVLGGSSHLVPGLVNVYSFAIENGPVEIVDLPSYNMVIFQFVSCMFTRG